LESKEAAKSSILYSYRHGFSGFAARLTESQAEAIAGNLLKTIRHELHVAAPLVDVTDKIADFPGVVQVIPNRIHKLHTTRSWDFIGINHDSSTNLLTKSSMGKGTIIGVIDSGNISFNKQQYHKKCT
jgi:hypothetical protein